MRVCGCGGRRIFSSIPFSYFYLSRVERSFLPDLPLVDHIDNIGVHDCFYAMGNCDGSEVMRYSVEGCLD